MVLGAALYAGEGSKVRKDNRGRMHYSIEFTNSEPRIISSFLAFLRSNFNVVEDRIKAELFIYAYHDELKVVNFWSKVTGIPISRFNKVIHLTQTSGRFKPSVYGTMKIRYHHKEHFLKLQSIIDGVLGGVT